MDQFDRADTGPDDHLTTGQLRQPEGLSQGIQQSLPDRRQVRRLLVQVLAQHHELVATEPSKCVHGSQGMCEPAGDRDEQPVPDRVAVRIVDLLEAVQVEEQQPGRSGLASDPRQYLLQPIQQQQSVRQPGQRVVQRLQA
jgi:hypothetical protein